MTDDDRDTNDTAERDTGSERKERVLHTRVPAVLEQELKRMAKSLRVPVSNVVRSILEDALLTVESVGRKAEGELHSAAERLARQRQELRRHREADTAEGTDADRADGSAAAADDPLAGVIGFSPIVLARDARCAVTGEELKAGADALMGVDERTGRRVIVSREVLSRIHAADD